jgi:hypothetical protein
MERTAREEITMHGIRQAEAEVDWLLGLSASIDRAAQRLAVKGKTYEAPDVDEEDDDEDEEDDDPQ